MFYIIITTLSYNLKKVGEIHFKWSRQNFKCAYIFKKVKTIIKRLHSHQNKEKQNIKKKNEEYAKRNRITNFQILTFVL